MNLGHFTFNEAIFQWHIMLSFPSWSSYLWKSGWLIWVSWLCLDCFVAPCSFSSPKEEETYELIVELFSFSESQKQFLFWNTLNQLQVSFCYWVLYWVWTVNLLGFQLKERLSSRLYRKAIVIDIKLREFY